MVGPQLYADVNALVTERLARRRPLVMAHRGSPGGSIAENTTLAALAALRSGADIVEIDVARSCDGTYVAFHDGFEAQHLGTEANLTTLTTAEIDQLSYRWLDRPDRRVRVERLTDLLAALPGDALVNLDRSWTWWPDLLPVLDRLQMTGRLLLKSPVRADLLQTLAEYPTPFPYLPICRSQADVDLALGYPGLNLVGVEIIAPTADAELFRPEVVDQVHQAGCFVLVNAEVLPIEHQCWPGLCDETAIAEGPEAGWGDLVARGFDVIQTDWPALLAVYRSSAGHRSRPPHGAIFSWTPWAKLGRRQPGAIVAGQSRGRL